MVQTDFKDERRQLQEHALKKLAFDELDLLTLNQILLRIYNIGYFQGRKDGEKMWEMPTELHLTLKQSTTNPSPKNNAYKHMRG